jgi:hypothetical protein
LEEIGADDGQCDGFSIKILGITRTNNIHLFKVEMGNGICDEYVDVRKRYTLKGLEQLHMSWDILGSNTFWLQ